MAFIIFDTSLASNDPWELLRLAGGDPLQSTYDVTTTTLTNIGVTQAVLDQALIDFNNGVQSTQKITATKANNEDVITNTDLALAILGDASSIISLQNMVGLTAPLIIPTLPFTPPTQPSATSIKANFTAIVAPTINDDINAGYSIGSVWIDTVGDSSYIAVDVTSTSAIWNQISIVTVPLNPVITVTTNHTILLSELYVFVDATIAPVTLTLPTAIGNPGHKIVIKKTDLTDNGVIPIASTGQFIDGLNIQLPLFIQYSSITVVSDGVNWFVI